MSEKNDKFHELAAKRVETINNAIRIFGNLHSANYEWTPDEVLEYFGQIGAAVDEAKTRFLETKRWRTSEPQVGSEFAPGASEAEIPDTSAAQQGDLDGADASDEVAQQPATIEVAKSAPGVPRNHPRNLTIAQIIAECAAGEKDMLAEMIILQRRVIYDQAQRLGEPATYPTLPAAA